MSLFIKQRHENGDKEAADRKLIALNQHADHVIEIKGEKDCRDRDEASDPFGDFYRIDLLNKGQFEIA